MAINAQQVKELREMTGVGMMDCKKALAEANGNIEEAVKILKEKGLAKAAKKAGRIATEGVVASAISDDRKKGVLFELNCETDFTARNSDFQGVASAILNHLMAVDTDNGKVVDMAENNDAYVEELTTSAVAKIGENIKARRYVNYVTAGEGFVHAYIHMGGKIGVMVNVTSEKNVAGNNEVIEMADDVAMHIAAMNPACVSTDEFPQHKLEEEKEIFKKQALESGKPESIVEKMIVGRIKKFVAENTLLEQPFVKNSDLTVKEYVAEVSKKAGSKLGITSFIRFELGEGLEKKSENFAEEVAAQLGK